VCEIFEQMKHMRLLIFGHFCSFSSLKMDLDSNGDGPTSWEELCNINLVPSELFLKFRKELQGIRVGLNLEVTFYALRILNCYFSKSNAF
jgi:hypothetical protein